MIQAPRSSPIALAASLAVIAACGGDGGSGTEPEAPGPEQYAGVWEGETSRGLSVRMVIGPGGSVDSLAVRVRLSLGVGTCTGPLLLDTPTQVQGSGFSAQATFPASNVATDVSGTFSSATSVSGTYGSFSGAFALTCGNSFNVGTGSLLSSGTWQASKTGS